MCLFVLWLFDGWVIFGVLLVDLEGVYVVLVDVLCDCELVIYCSCFNEVFVVKVV